MLLSNLIIFFSFLLSSESFFNINVKLPIKTKLKMNQNEQYNEPSKNMSRVVIPLKISLKSNNTGLPNEMYRNVTYPDINDIEPEDLFEKFENATKSGNIYRQNLFLKKIQQKLRERTNDNNATILILDNENNDEYDIFEKNLNNINNTTPHSRINGLNETEYDDETARYFEETLRQQMQSGMPPGIRVFFKRNEEEKKETESENFEVIQNLPYNFNQVGGYENVKAEMMQSVDMLKNFEKYAKFNVRVPKGLILEGPPGNGKTLLARAFSGEVNSSFIAVSGSQFQEKYVGVGASRIRELFELARKNTPCVIFIDEVDALGRSRSLGNVDANTERDQTLNELLVALDGYKNSSGIFVVGATNRVDLLDPALMRPGRIDKKIYIGNPDAKTREAILNIHIEGKPVNKNVEMSNLIEMSNGLSGAQIENLLNEAMLLALREDREEMNSKDLETILGRVYGGYQPIENAFSDDMIYRISIHEMGHALIGLMSPNHPKLVKVCLNLWSPSSPGYTIFEHPEVDSLIFTKERLMERLTVLLGGRIAEEIFFGNSITSGASNDLERAHKLAEEMICKYGMGKKTIYAYKSETSKEFIDRDIERLIESAYQSASHLILSSKDIIDNCAIKLVENKLLIPEEIIRIIHSQHIQNNSNFTLPTSSLKNL